MGIVLASKSPRRSELLRMIGIKEFKVMSSDIVEEIDAHISPEENVERLAFQKASFVAKLCSDEDVIIGADTLVICNDIYLGKPCSADDAFSMLKMLSNKWHKVISGVCVIKGDSILLEHEITEVKFRSLTSHEIISYVSSGDSMDKAGSYGIQGKASLFIEKIIGDYYNVVGLPVCLLGKMLYKQEVTLF